MNSVKEISDLQGLFLPYIVSKGFLQNDISITFI